MFHEKNRERHTETLLLTTFGYSRLHTNMPQNTTEDNYEKELDYAWTHQYGQERCECRPNAFLSDSSQEDDLDHFKDCAREFAYT